ncbi:MAG: hypothetical protein ACRELA_06350 [Candidatus Rokuibacteriota bacterium]
MGADLRFRARLPLLGAALLTAATVFFLWGALAERSAESGESTETAAREKGGKTETPSEASEEGGHTETAAERAAESGDGAGEEGAHREREFRPLGVNLESVPLLLAGALVSLALAALVVLRTRRETLLAVLALAVGFTVLESVEVAHQADAGQTGLLVLALLAAVLHAGAGVVTVRLLIPAPVKAVPGSVD